MVIAKKAETEVMDNKAGVATGKAGVVNNDHNVEIQALSRQISTLMSMFKGSQGNGEKPKGQSF